MNRNSSVDDVQQDTQTKQTSTRHTTMAGSKAPSVVSSQLEPSGAPRRRSSRSRASMVELPKNKFPIVRTIFFSCWSLMTLALLIILIIYFDNCFEKKVTRCSTQYCVDEGKRMTELKNYEINPCDNFADFACSGSATTSYFNVVGYTLILVQFLKGMVTEEIQHQEAQYLKNIKTFYTSCASIGSTAGSKLNAMSYVDSSFDDDWPSLNPSWNETSFDLNKLLLGHASQRFFVLFKVSVDINAQKPTQYIIHLEPADLQVPSKFLESNSASASYVSYLTNFLVALGANTTTAEADAEDLVKLDTELFTILPTETQRLAVNDPRTLNHETTLRQLALDYTYMDIVGVIRAVFADYKISLPENEPIVNMYPSYFQKLEHILANTTSRVKQNKFMFTYFHHKLSDVDTTLSNLKKNSGMVKTSAVWSLENENNCMAFTAQAFDLALSSYLMENRVEADIATRVETMFANLKASMSKLVEEMAWMSSSVKDVAYNKLDNMKARIGYATMIDTDLDNLYGKVNLSPKPEDFIKNRALAQDIKDTMAFTKLRKKVDNTRWQLKGYDTYLKYQWRENVIEIPAGLLISNRYYSMEAPEYLNYARLGCLMAREMFHAIDVVGSHTGTNGQLQTWWTTAEYEVFSQKGACFQKMFNDLTKKSTVMNVPGAVTRENMADLAGFSVSFRAYRDIVEPGDQSLPVPTLGLTKHQTFYLAYAQLFCSNEEPTIDPRVTDRSFRQRNVVVNSPDFGHVYDCPTDSVMNPKTKCSLM